MKEIKLSYEELEVVEEMSLPDWATRTIGVASLIIMVGGVVAST